MESIFRKIIGLVKAASKRLANIPKSAPEVCDFVCNQAEKAGHPIKNFEGSIHFYDGLRWVEFPVFQLKVFIKELLTGIWDDPVAGSAGKSIEDTYKQMGYTTMSLSVNPPKNCVNFMNGILDLSGSSPVLKPHSPSEFIRYVLPYDYDPAAECPMFHKYLDRVLPDKSVQDVLAEFCGWVFAPDLKLEKGLFFWGNGCNGKSVAMDIITAAFGKENVSHESLSDLCGEMGDRSRANLSGKLLNACSDVAPNAFHGDIFKRLVSGEAISVRKLYQDVNILTDYGKQMFCLNELPKTNDRTSGYYRRFLIIPFNVQIPKEEIDRKLASRIIANELPGVMNWILEGRARLIKNECFSESEIIDKALEDYRNQHNQ